MTNNTVPPDEDAPPHRRRPRHDDTLQRRWQAPTRGAAEIWAVFERGHCRRVFSGERAEAIAWAEENVRRGAATTQIELRTGNASEVLRHEPFAVGSLTRSILNAL